MLDFIGMEEIADPTRFAEGLTALSFESKAKVDDLLQTALKAGAVESSELQDYGFMYGRSFDDLDGHTWIQTTFRRPDGKLHQSSHKARREDED